MDPQTVERIVQEVLRRLRERTNGHHSEETQGDEGLVHIAERVVSLAVLEDKWQHMKQLAVSPRAVVTPAVHDELRRRGIALVRNSRHGESGAVAPAVIIAAATAGGAERDWSNWLTGLPVLLQPHSCPSEAVDECVAQVRKGNKAIVITQRTAEAVCRANRQQGVRAACGWDAAAIREALEMLQANLLVLDPRRLGRQDLRNAVRMLGAAAG